VIALRVELLDGNRINVFEQKDVDGRDAERPIHPGMHGWQDRPERLGVSWKARARDPVRVPVRPCMMQPARARPLDGRNRVTLQGGKNRYRRVYYYNTYI
jgi:hypothetical protein